MKSFAREVSALRLAGLMGVLLSPVSLVAGSATWLRS